MVKNGLGCVLLFTGISLLMTEVSAYSLSSLLPCDGNHNCTEMELCAPDRKCRAPFISLGGVFMSDSLSDAELSELLANSVAIVTSTKHLVGLAIILLACVRLLL